MRANNDPFTIEEHLVASLWFHEKEINVSSGSHTRFFDMFQYRSTKTKL
jgi:hypothetical protein